ncbi:MAG: HypC/HybG/HupF family hydrogenase formation chaperone [Synergistaceae bacterium]|jgi:hydrogenase expression/formation protein HypC|nr:HypC/HybG/HupF family hydrogenase formation chaperone [Synergistaceae bacterium]
MCLAVPHTIREIFDDGSARAVSGGVELDVRLDLIESPAVGDTVLVHAGFAIQKLDRGESEELIALWSEIDEAAKASVPND